MHIGAHWVVSPHCCTIVACLLKRKKSEHHREKTPGCPLHHKDWLVETDFLPLEFPVVQYSPTAPVLVEQISSSSPRNITVPTFVPFADWQGMNMEEISQYYIFPEKSS